MSHWKYQVDSNGKITQAHAFRFDSESEAREAATALAEKHLVDVYVLKLIVAKKIEVVSTEFDVDTTKEQAI